jgi:formate dehydrogenase maturation protein FdhE
MIPELKNLTESEIDLLKKIPAMVTILIAGADEEISKSELKEAINLTKIKQSKARKELLSYYQDIAPDFEKSLNELLDSYPKEAEVRSKQVVEEIERLNDILKKVDKNWAIQFVDSMKDIAKKVAEAAGGVFGYLSIGYEESKLIDLKMIKVPD